MKNSNFFQNVLVCFIALFILLKSGNGQEIEKFGVVNPDFGDYREPISNTSEFPWRAVCKIRATFLYGDVAEGTGTVIGPRYVLTAAHVVHDMKLGGTATTCEIIPGYDGYNYNQKKPYGSFYSNEIYVHQEYAEQDYQEYLYPDYTKPSDTFDIAVITTNTDIGERTGWLGIRAANDTQLQNTLNVAGYPAWPGLDDDTMRNYPRHFDGEKMYRNSGNLSYIGSKQVSYSFAISAGMSGSGIYQKESGERYIVAVVKSEDAGKYGRRKYFGESNYATRITQDVLEWIRSIKRTVYVKYASSYPYGIKFKVERIQYEFFPGQNTPVHFSGEDAVLWLWECPPSGCRWSQFTITAGEKYRIIDSGYGQGLTLRRE